VDGNTTVEIRTPNQELEKNIVIFSKSDKIGHEATLYFVDANNELIAFRNNIVFDNGYTAFITPFVNARYEIKVK
jgi:hypothetical protein